MNVSPSSSGTHPRDNSATNWNSPMDTLNCQFCGRDLRALDEYFVNPAGELVGCASCADQRGLAGEVLPQEEWNTPAVVPDVLAQFGVTNAEVHKPAPTPTQQPRTHYWEVTAPSGRYFLRRFYSWYPASAITYMHSVTAHLQRGRFALPVPQYVPAPNGLSYVELGGASWALYRALEGRGATAQEWMWYRPKAAEMLAQMHVAMDGFTPEGEPFRPWGAWTLDTVDRVLDSWNPHPDLTPELLGHIRDRLAERYFGELYPELPKLVVHGDYVAANVLWRGDAMNAQVSGVLDFEKAHLDTPLFDFAWGLGDRRPPLVRATLAAYTRVRPLSNVEREALPESLLLGALMGIDMQMTYYNNLEEVTRQAQDLQLLLRDIESIRKVAAPK